MQKRSPANYSRWDSKGTTPFKNFAPKKNDKQEEKSKTASRWAKGKCFKCQEPWIPGHNKTCKFRNQVHLISIQDDNFSDEDNTDRVSSDEATLATEDPELQISMHAISGTSSHAKTFPLFLHIGTHKMVALVDTGSTTSFIDPSSIEKVDITVANHDPVQVTAANGNILWTHAMTPSCSYSIQGHAFTSDFRVLELQGYDVILGCDWIYDYSPERLNLKTREFTIEMLGQRITFKDETLPNKHFLVTHRKMQKLLRKGAIGGVLYVQAMQMQAPDTTTTPSIAALLH
jgi:hypothetical protein